MNRHVLFMFYLKFYSDNPEPAAQSSSLPSSGSSGNISVYSTYDSKLSINDFDLLKVKINLPYY